MLVAAPNLALDHVVRLTELRPGEVQRFREADVRAGGKGVNVCRTARLLGAKAQLVALVPGRTGEAVADLLAMEGVDLVAVPCSGEVRAATIVIEDSGRVTVLNEPGPRVSVEEWAPYEEAVQARAGKGWLACSGSLPPDAPVDAYARLASGRKALVDATGQVLASALEARPEWVTPNLNEAEEALFGRAWQSTSGGADAAGRASSAAAELVKRGARNAAVTAGPVGVAVDGAEGTYFVRAPWIRQRNPIGAGDSFASALLVALEAGRPPAEAVRNAVAVAAASVETDVPGLFDPERARRLELEALV